ncbi:MAG: hypothetical protein KAS38_03840 [Anaerolineales bacterium]|nr:hypothetical protein [Anaerolineales bacterium]
MTNSQPRLNPYVGPRAFQTGEKLYGRDRELRELLDLLIAERIVLLYSPSGAGKSSLIQAGLTSMLEQEGFCLQPVIRVNLEPPPELPKDEHFNRYVYSVLMSLEENLDEEQHTPNEQLASMNLAEYLAGCPREEGAPENEVLIFDQFEEILTVDPTDREGKLAFSTNWEPPCAIATVGRFSRCARISSPPSTHLSVPFPLVLPTPSGWICWGARPPARPSSSQLASQVWILWTVPRANWSMTCGACWCSNLMAACKNNWAHTSNRCSSR